MNYTPIPLISPTKGFNESVVSYESMNLRNSISSLDSETLIKVITNHTNAERMLIIQTYQSDFHRNVIDDLKAEFYGEFAELAEALLLRPMDYVGLQINRGFGRAGLHVKTITELLCTLSNEDINKLKAEYKQRFKRELVEQVHAEVSGNLRQLFLYILNGSRNENARPDEKIAVQQAKELLNIVDNDSDKFESHFVELIATKTFSQLRLIFAEYDKLGPDYKLDRLIESKLRGEIRSAVKVCVDIARNLPAHFATRLCKAMEGWSTDNHVVMSIIVCRSEIDLGNIRNEYKRIYDRDLVRDIKSDTKGDYKRCLLAIIDKK